MTVSHNLGFPRIGPHRELKFAVEKYWKGEMSAPELTAAGAKVRADCRARQSTLDKVPVGDFAWYDQVLNHSVMFGLVPQRFADGDNALDTYFRMARGRAPTGKDARACEMTKWFDTNYHYIVPELSADATFSLNAEEYMSMVTEAIDDLGADKVKPVLIGPLTYLKLGKGMDNPLALLPRLLPCYVELLKSLASRGISWVQMDEPALVLDLDDVWRGAYRSAYEELGNAGVNVLLATYFGSIGDNLDTALSLPVAGLHLDRVRGSDDLQHVLAGIGDKVLSLGVVDGRNIWRTDFAARLGELRSTHGKIGDRLWVGPSCSLLHSPVDLDTEKKLQPAEIKPWLAFATQKVQEIQALKQAVADASSVEAALNENKAALDARRASPLATNPEVRSRCDAVTPKMSDRHSPYAERSKVQQQEIDLPAFPTTTIGSFPQTAQIRKTRRQYRNGELSDADYKTFVESEIRNAVTFQEKVGLDVLVHGEAERNDMVEYFGELMSGFAFSSNGWVQSYGSRCVKPPIIYGDVSRPEPMTVNWISYAQEQTSRPMKGMLTGPVTILCWSFPRDDIARMDICQQIALALRDEVSDLETAGVKIIQMDEPAFREGLPLRRDEWQEYLRWAAECFRLSVCSAADQTQIHTHMCYSEFNDIIGAIADMDADVITIETARSDMELLEVFREFSYPNEIGPGVYDIHSPLVPASNDMTRLMQKAAGFIPHQRLWVNPDCGLKTRGWPETEAALVNMVNTAQELRQKYAS